MEEEQVAEAQQTSEEDTEIEENESVEEAQGETDGDEVGEENGETEEDESEDEKDGTEEVAEAPKKTILKVYGKEIEVDSDKLVALAQKGMAADKQIFDTEKQREELLSVINDMRDPKKLFPILEKLGHDTRKLTEEYVWEQLEREKMNEDQRRAYEWEKKARALEAKQQQQEAEKQRQIAIAEQEKLSQEYEAEFEKALTEVDIPKDRYSVSKMAYYMESALTEGIEISAKDAALLVQQDIENDYKEKAEKYSPEQLVKLFGDKMIAKLKNYDLSKIKSPEDKNKIKTKVEQKAVPKKRIKKKSYQQLKEELDNLYGGDPFEE